MINPDKPCEHENFAAFVDVNRITDSTAESATVKGYAADIRVWCGDCAEAFVFIGAPVGVSPGQPMVSLDGSELRVPLRPVSADDAFGLALPGFHMELPDDNK